MAIRDQLLSAAAEAEALHAKAAALHDAAHELVEASYRRDDEPGGDLSRALNNAKATAAIERARDNAVKVRRALDLMTSQFKAALELDNE